jgi:putative transposase
MSKIEPSDYPPPLLERAQYRLSVIEPLLSLPPEQQTYDAVANRVKELKATQTGDEPLSPASLYRWLKAYKNSEYDIRSLIGNTLKCGHKGESRLQTAQDTIIYGVIDDLAFQRTKITNRILFQEIAVHISEENATRLQNDQLSMPSLATVNHRLRQYKVSERYAAKHGKVETERKYKLYRRTETPRLPLERVEIDHTRADLMVVDETDNLPLGRFNLPFCLDVCTRYPLGYYLGFEAPSANSILQCLHRSIRPKPNTREMYGTKHEWVAHGVSHMLITDHGKDFTSKHLERIWELNRRSKMFK